MPYYAVLSHEGYVLNLSERRHAMEALARLPGVARKVARIVEIATLTELQTQMEEQWFRYSTQNRAPATSLSALSSESPWQP